MRVLTLTSLFPSERNPFLGLAVYRRLKALARLCELRVVAPRRCDGVPEHEVVDGIEVFRPRWWRVPKVGVLVDGYVLAEVASRAIHRACPELDFDVIDAHWVYPDGFAATRVAQRLGKPLTLTARGTDVEDFCFRWPVRRFARRALRGADRLIAVSRALKSRMVEAGADPDRIAVVANGVDTAVYHRGDRAVARGTLGVPADAVVLFSVGALIPTKGYRYLIEGLALLPSEPALRLYVAGQGPQEQALRRLSEEKLGPGRVVFLGARPEHELVLWYHAADLFCFGSLREGCPNVILESLACGTPVVSTNVGGIPDLVDDETGVLFEAGSAKAFAEALKEALARTWDRDAVAARGGQRTWDQVAREVHAVLEGLLGESGVGA